MICLDHFAAGEVGDGASKFEDAMIGAGGEVELLRSSFEQFFTRGIYFAEIAHFGGSHFGVAGQFGAGEALELAFAGGLDAATDGGGVLDLAFVGEFFVIDAGDFDVDVDAVKEGAADAFLVAGDGGGATAFF